MFRAWKLRRAEQYLAKKAGLAVEDLLASITWADGFRTLKPFRLRYARH